jgi:hypothetical protein
VREEAHLRQQENTGIRSSNPPLARVPAGAVENLDDRLPASTVIGVPPLLARDGCLSLGAAVGRPRNADAGAVTDASAHEAYSRILHMHVARFAHLRSPAPSTTSHGWVKIETAAMASSGIFHALVARFARV